MNIYFRVVILLILTLLIGSEYYYIMESSIPRDENCSFIASPWTDFLAFISGMIIIFKGINYDDNILIILGGSIIVEHIWQLYPKNVLRNVINGYLNNN